MDEEIQCETKNQSGIEKEGQMKYMVSRLEYTQTQGAITFRTNFTRLNFQIVPFFSAAANKLLLNKVL